MLLTKPATLFGTRWAFLMCCLFVVLSVGCQPPTPGGSTPDFCQEDTDCGAQSKCLNQLCVSRTTSPDASGQLWDGIPSYQCNIGETKSCTLAGGDKGSMLCIKGPTGRGEWSGLCGCKPGDKKECYTGPDGTQNNKPCRAGEQICDDAGKWGECQREVKPKQEQCNGIDDDCDGEIDDGLVGCRCEVGATQSCYPGETALKGVGACKEGTQTCGKDGKWGECTGFGSPSEEKCNGIDDDCNGQVDETYPTLGEPCSAGVGQCKDVGKFECNDKGDGVICKAEAKDPKEEECNGKDDDCDGDIDEGPSGGTLSRTCYSADKNTIGKGRCQAGTQICEKGQWSKCEGEVLPEPKEVCDGEDNDCNGAVDDGLSECYCAAGAKASCYTSSPWTIGIGVCQSGIRVCDSAGKWGQCQGEVKPSPEICNNKDDNCDGKTDENLYRPCPMQRDGCVQKMSADGKTIVVCQGLCQAGLQQCTAGKWSNTCSGAVMPAKEICDGQDNNCDGQTDEGNPDGGGDCTTTGNGPCGKGQFACTNGVLKCVSKFQLTREICNGVDDDCDGQVDEDQLGKPLQQSCYTGAAGTKDKGPCKAGFQVCSSGRFGLCEKEVTPTQEFCDTIDNDCNGKIDDGIRCNCTKGDTRKCGLSKGECKEGTQSCDANGNWGACVGAVGPQPELCDGKDNNCDGQVDESFPNLGSACHVGQGECRQEGKWICDPKGTSVICDAAPGSPSPETCNGKDDDCDGQTDEGLSGFGKDCTIGGLDGECAKGKTACVGSQRICSQIHYPTLETCNGKDDDCNGKVDDNLTDVGKVCNGTLPGNCARGVTVCDQGSLVCKTPSPTNEVCNGRDDDCDGKIDEICGAQHNYIAFYGAGDASNALRGYQVTSTSNAGNGVVVFSSGTACEKQPLIITPISKRPSGATFSCSNLRTGIVTFSRSGATGAKLTPGPVPFHAIAPKSGLYGIVTCQKIGTTSQIECTVTSNNPTAIAIDKYPYTNEGVVKLYTDHCKDDRTSGGATVKRPFFATLMGNTPGYIQTWSAGNVSHGSLGQTGKCEIKMFNESGSFAIRSFSFWFPPKDTEVWAGTGKPSGAQSLGVVMETSDFNAGFGASWTSRYSVTSVPAALELQHPSWMRSFSLIIATPQFFNFGDTTPYLISASILPTASTGYQVGLHTFKRENVQTIPTFVSTDQPSIVLYGRRF